MFSNKNHYINTVTERWWNIIYTYYDKIYASLNQLDSLQL